MAQSAVEISSTTGGWVCPTCGYWVYEYENHVCADNMAQPTIPFIFPVPATSWPHYWPDPRVDELERRVAELEKKLKEKRT